MRGERPDATGTKYLEARGMNPGTGRELAGGAIDILATPAFNPLMKAGGKVTAPLAKTAAGKRIAGVSAGGALYGGTEAFSHEEPAAEVAKRAITDAILFGGTEAGLIGLGAAGRKVFSFGRNPVDTNIENGRRAMQTVIRNQTDVLNAMHRPDVGDISFYWGTPKHGVRHIIKRRSAQGYNGEEIANKMVDVIGRGKRGEIYGPEGGQRVNISDDEHTAVLSLFKDGDKETWLLTGWNDIKGEPGVSGKGYGLHETTHSEPMRTRSRMGADSLNNNIPPNNTQINLSRESIYDSTRDELQNLFNTVDPKANISDITGFQGYSRDVYRNLRDAFGNNFEAVKKMLLDPFDSSKAGNIRFQEEILKDLKANVVDRLGIKKGSKESKLVQRYGEKTMTPEEWFSLSPELQRKIADADIWFRTTYDRLIDEVNRAKEEIYPFADDRMASITAKIEDLKTPGKYSRKAQSERIQALQWELDTLRKNPRRRSTEDTLYMKKLENKIEDIKNDPLYTAQGRRTMIDTLEKEHERALRGKRVLKRDDYYRHFREMTEGFEGLRNIFDSPANIDPALEGISHQTLPRSKWASFTQQRKGGAAYDLDAVGGFLDYAPAASYSIHIDPHISRFEALADELAEATALSKNANNLVRFLKEYSQDLAGKTNPADRFIQEAIPGGRQAFNGLVWVNNRIKANTVLANASSAVAQVANVPQGIAFAKQYSAPGLTRTFASILGKNEASAQSGFLAERFAGKMYRQFDESLLSKPKNFAVWVMETSDRIGTEFIWNSCYEKAIAEGIANPIKFADFNTRRLVAGRGIGEAPLGQKAKVFQLIAPFQLEVGNLWHVMGDMKKDKDLTGLAVLSVALWMFNRGAEKLRGSGVTFDPLEALIDSFGIIADDKDNKGVRVAGRLTGEVLSNVPLGQTAASWYPEYGFNFMGGRMPGRKEFFGREDPTRFGTGPLLTKAVTSPHTRLLLPFGGVQAEKTYKGLEAIGEGGVYTPDGAKLKYPVATDVTNMLKGLLFGPGGFREARDYYEEGRSPLTEKQTMRVMQSGSPGGQYMQTLVGRSKRALNSQLGAIENDSSLTPMEKAKRKAELRQKYREQQNN